MLSFEANNTTTSFGWLFLLPKQVAQIPVNLLPRSNSDRTLNLDVVRMGISGIIFGNYIYFNATTKKIKVGVEVAAEKSAKHFLPGCLEARN